MNVQQKQPPKLTGHNYEGIEEYDNPMPGWWSWLFGLTVVFAVLYFFFALAAGDYFSPRGVFNSDLQADADRQFAAMGDVKTDAASLLKLSGDEQITRIGRSLFQTNCVACHGTAGAGLSGPNLTDDFYLHVKKPEDVVDVIKKGRLNGAMPAWENRLQPREAAVVAAYVISLRGQNLPGREAQGEKIPPFSAAATTPVTTPPATPATPK